MTTLANMLNSPTTDITINTVRAGLGAGGTSSATMFAAGTTGTYTGVSNSVFGYQAGKAISSGTLNTCFGAGAGIALTTASVATCIGYNAGAGSNTSYMTCIGANAGASYTGGNYVVLVGYNAGYNTLNPTGGPPVGVGDNVLYSLTTGTLNTAVGSSALYSLVSASACTAFGYQCLYNCTGASNTAFGSGAGSAGASGATALTSGTSNTFFGYQAGCNSATAVGTLALGAGAVADISTGSTSGTNGPGVAIGSAAYPIGFRGDASLYPSAGVGGGTLPLTFTGYWRIKINGTYYKIPLYPDS